MDVCSDQGDDSCQNTECSKGLRISEMTSPLLMSECDYRASV